MRQKRWNLIYPSRHWQNKVCKNRWNKIKWKTKKKMRKVTKSWFRPLNKMRYLGIELLNFNAFYVRPKTPLMNWKNKLDVKKEHKGNILCDLIYLLSFWFSLLFSWILNTHFFRLFWRRRVLYHFFSFWWRYCVLSLTTRLFLFLLLQILIKLVFFLDLRLSIAFSTETHKKGKK